MWWSEATRRLASVLRRAASRALLSTLSPLSLAPGFQEAKKVLQVNQEIAQLESASKFDQAREIRDRVLDMVDARLSAPLWRSRGFDLLRLGQPREALEAFENGIRHLNDCRLLYGVVPPDELYYGALLAALRVGNLARAAEYYEKTIQMIGVIRKEFPAEHEPAWWNAGLDLARRQLKARDTTQPTAER